MCGEVCVSQHGFGSSAGLYQLRGFASSSADAKFLCLGLSSLVLYENSAGPQASVGPCLAPIPCLKVALGVNVVHVSLRW